MKPELAIIGGSAGSLQVVIEILSLLKETLSYSILCVFHRKSTSQGDLLITLLQSKSNLPIKEAEDKEIFRPGYIYVAPANYHVLIEMNHSFSLDISEKVNFSRPSIDVTLFTAAEALGDKLIAVILSGANSDGILGLKKVKEKGGYCIAQDPITAVVPYMPAQAIKNKAVHVTASITEIIALLNGK